MLCSIHSYARTALRCEFCRETTFALINATIRDLYASLSVVRYIPRIIRNASGHIAGPKTETECLIKTPDHPSVRPRNMLAHYDIRQWYVPPLGGLQCVRWNVIWQRAFRCLPSHRYHSLSLRRWQRRHVKRPGEINLYLMILMRPSSWRPVAAPVWTYK